MTSTIVIRPYQPIDYEQVADLYRHSELYGGQFDENRDSRTRLFRRISSDSQAILVAELADEIVGTVSLIEEGRVAWLFRFAVRQGIAEEAIARKLCAEATAILKGRGHRQVLVYAPTGNKQLSNRYESLGFNKGGDYTCFWSDI